MDELNKFMCALENAGILIGWSDFIDMKEIDIDEEKILRQESEQT